ncbi:hypothetical protein M3J09_001773 [Ascochyta lentis]
MTRTSARLGSTVRRLAAGLLQRFLLPANVLVLGVICIPRSEHWLTPQLARIGTTSPYFVPTRARTPQLMHTDCTAHTVLCGATSLGDSSLGGLPSGDAADLCSEWVL